MLNVRARLERVRRNGTDAGVTLTELLVSMGLMSIVAALALGWLIGENTSDTKTTNSTFATSDARVVLQAWPALLRVADSPSNGYASAGATVATTIAPGLSTGRFLAITSTSITFNADLGNRAGCTTTCTRGDTTQVTLSLANGALSQSLVSNGTTNSKTYVSSGAALTGPAACLFTAYGPTGASLGCSSTTPLGSIANVALAFTVTPAQSGAKQTFQTSTAITGTFAPALPAATAGT